MNLKNGGSLGLKLNIRYTGYSNIMGSMNIDECPECKAKDIMNHGGCLTCMDCGWSACPSG